MGDKTKERTQAKMFNIRKFSLNKVFKTFNTAR